MKAMTLDFKLLSVNFFMFCMSMFILMQTNISYAQYDSLSRVNVKKYSEFSVNYKRGLINIKTGDTLLQPKYRQIEVFSEGLARVHLNNSVGYIDTTGRFIIPLGKYSAMRGGSERGMFSDGLAVVKKDNLFGAINKFGQVIIPFESRQLYSFKKKTAITLENGKYGLINTENVELLKREYDRLRKYKSIIYLTKNNKMAYADMNGQLLCLFEFDKISPNRFGGVILNQNGKEGYADNKGNELIKCQFDRIFWYDPVNKTVWLKDKNVFTIKTINLETLVEVPNGKVILSTTVGNPRGIYAGDSIQYYSAKGIAVTDVYDYVSEKHASAYRFRDGKCIVNKNGKWGLINQNGVVLVPFKYDWLMPPSKLNYLIAKKGNLNGMLDTNNVVVLKFKLRSINRMHYLTIDQLNEVIKSENWQDSIASIIKIKSEEAVRIARRKDMFYESESSDIDVCTLKEQDDLIYWEVLTYKNGYTKKGDCAYTNGCSIIYRKVIKINAITGKVINKKSTKTIYPNYE